MYQALRKLAKSLLNDICFLLLLPSYCRPKKTIEHNNIQNVLLVNLQGIGDVLMTTQCIRQLKKHYPNANIDYCCYKNNGTFLEDNPNINKIIKRMQNDLWSIDFLRTLQQIRKNKYDLIINLYHAQHSALVTVLSNAQYKMGNLYNTACTTNNLAVENSSKTWDVRINAKHSANQLGIMNYDETILEIMLQEKEKKEVEEICREAGIKKPVIGINANAVWKAKTWPVEHWITLINEIKKKYKEYSIVIIGSQEDKVIAEEIAIKTHVVSLAGRLSLKQTAEALKNMKLFITGDTGPLHIAAATKTKTIALFGVTDPKILINGAKKVTILSTYDSCPKKWRYNHNNMPPDKAQQQIAQITPEKVMKEVKRILHE